MDEIEIGVYKRVRREINEISENIDQVFKTSEQLYQEIREDIEMLAVKQRLRREEEAMGDWRVNVAEQRLQAKYQRRGEPYYPDFWEIEELHKHRRHPTA